MDPHPSTSVPTGREVLVVEDEVRLRNMLSQALKQMGFTATLVPTAEAAQRALAQRSYDILMLDLNLPGMSGMELLESIRGRRGLDIQVIILTGFGDLEAARKAIHFDVVEFLTKPCALGSLEVALDRASKRRRGQIVSGTGADVRELEFETAPRPAPAVSPKEAGPASDTPAAAASLDELEQQHILGTLKKHGGNRSATAAELGISLRKLYYRLGEYQKRGVIP